MKNLCTFVLALLTLVFVCNTLSNAEIKTLKDGVLQIKKAGEVPIIDGQLDDVWNTVTATPLLKTEGRVTIPDTVMPYDDHTAWFRVMWDEDNLYIFVQSVDDTIKTEINTSSPWLNDCVELFLDGGNEKATSYDVNDIQWRWVINETPGNAPASGNAPGEWAWYKTNSGYNFECAIPQASLTQFTLESDTEIGFEISNGDLETAASPQLVLHWWTNDGTTWNNPSLFGTAVLTSEETTPIMSIPYTADAPTIDGVMSEGEGWMEVGEELQLVKFEGAPTIYPEDSTYINWKDHTASFWTMWDKDNLYIFVKDIDDTLKTDINTGSPWLNDCVELFLDGGNEKATSYDANDIQWRWVYPEVPGTAPASGNAPGEWAWNEFDGGVNFELAIPQASLTQFTLEDDTEIGFEISNGDLETAASAQHVLHWWTNVATTWNNPSLFGTAVLGKSTVGVEKKNDKALSYDLKQNYPNPFNPTTKISFSLVEEGMTVLSVYNILGQEVRKLVNQNLRPGTYNVNFDATDLRSGVYFYKLESGNTSMTKKMLLMK